MYHCDRYMLVTTLEVDSLGSCGPAFYDRVLGVGSLFKRYKDTGDAVPATGHVYPPAMICSAEYFW
jgi:hypothetical protein